MKNYLITYFVRLGEKKYPRWYRLSSLLGTIGLVFFLLPWLFISLGTYSEKYAYLNLPAVLTHGMAGIALMLGTVLLVWTLRLQYGYAQGSGSHMVPTQKLIVTGPYKLCRHPMQLGAVLFYFGLVTVLSSLTMGLCSALATGLMGFIFDFFIEEPVLVMRFGTQYKQYQKDVPLIPFLFAGPNNRNREHKACN